MCDNEFFLEFLCRLRVDMKHNIKVDIWRNQNYNKIDGKRK